MRTCHALGLLGLAFANTLSSCSTDSGSTNAAAGSTLAGSVGTGGNPGNSGGNAAASGGAGVAGGSAGALGSSAAGSAGSTAGSAGATNAGTANAGSANAGGNNGGAAGVSASGGATQSGVTVKLDSLKQTMDGFGINDTWASDSAAMDDAQADALFNTTGKGIGLSILRVGMGSNGSYMSANIPNDIKLAKARGVKTIIGSCWSPPADWKTGQTGGGNPPNQENGGGHVTETHYDEWATRITKFATDNGLSAMSIANEPDFASCGKAEPCNGDYPTTLYTAEEMVKFIKVAGPKLKAAGIKVIAPEASEWIHTWSNTSAGAPDWVSVPGGKNSSDPLKCGFPATMCAAGKGYDYGHALFNDKMAWAAFDIMGVHQYDTQVATPWPSDVPEKKTVWQTEMSGVKWWKDWMPTGDISNGVVVAGWIHDAIVNGDASAWIWWWYKSTQTDDNEGLLLMNGNDTRRHYTLGNFSKFIRPGYTRVEITGSAGATVLLSAYKGQDNTVVIVAINQGSAALSVPIAISGGTAPATLTPWVTSATQDLVSVTAVPVSGGSFTAALAGTSVTTFVGK
jgi:glucuronoarabinoxylan endo-1,4-beta-xylanase